MSIQLLSISHKTAPMQVRELFAFDKEKQLEIIKKLLDTKEIEEAVLLATCNRTELYCSKASGSMLCDDAAADNRVLAIMQSVLLEAANAADSGISDYILRFQNERAIHHLFRVTAGLDSAVIGEDQILGQVKQAYFLSKQYGAVKGTFNTLFRMAITAAKRVKTDTLLSKTPVSTATLALRTALECVNNRAALHQKINLMIIGATGNIGSIVLKDALDIKDLNIFVTVRKELPQDFRSMKQKENVLSVIPYEKRYEYLDKMDIVISATSSPHYTITKQHFVNACKNSKRRVFFDLAVPSDIEPQIAESGDTIYYSMEDMAGLAQRNNALKQSMIPKAEEILKKYEDEFLKNEIFSKNKAVFDKFQEGILTKMQEKPPKQVLSQLIYRVKSESSAAEFAKLMEIVKKIADE